MHFNIYCFCMLFRVHCFVCVMFGTYFIYVYIHSTCWAYSFYTFRIFTIPCLVNSFVVMFTSPRAFCCSFVITVWYTSFCKHCIFYIVLYAVHFFVKTVLYKAFYLKCFVKNKKVFMFTLLNSRCNQK